MRPGSRPSDLDPSFGKGGRSYQPNALSELGTELSSFNSLRLLPDGRIVALGWNRCRMGCFDQVVARYTPSGKPDRSYGTPGLNGAPTVLGVGMFPGEDPGTDDASRSFAGVAVADDGGLVLGYVDRPAGPLLVRRAPDGAETAALVQPARTSPFAILPDGRVLAFRDGRVVLLRTDGTVDPVLGGETAGVELTTTGPATGIVADGAAIVAATDPDGIALARIPLDGSPVVRGHIPLRRPSDSPFISFVPTDLGVDANGGVKVLVHTYRQSGFDDAPRRVIGAFTALGQADRRFGGGDGMLGIAGIDPQIAVQRNGKVVIVASYARKAGDSARPLIGVRRLNAGGRADRTFRAHRLRSVADNIYGLDVALDRRGRIVIGAGAFTTHGSSGVLLVRLRGGEAPRPKAR